MDPCFSNWLQKNQNMDIVNVREHGLWSADFQQSNATTGGEGSWSGPTLQQSPIQMPLGKSSLPSSSTDQLPSRRKRKGPGNTDSMNTINPQSKRKARMRFKHCPISVCQVQFRCHSRRHANELHLPEPFKDPTLYDQSFHNDRMELLLFLKNRLIGRNNSFRDLIHWVNNQSAISKDAFVAETEISFLTQTCMQQKWKVPRTFTLVPVNSEAVLCHWKVLLVMLNHLSDEEREVFKHGEVSERVQYLGDSLGDVDNVIYEDETINSSLIRSDFFEAFDSHFHADRLSQTLFGHSRTSVLDLINADVGCRPRINVSVVGGVMVYSDPESLPDQLPCVKGFGSAIGVHPRKCHLLNEERFRQIVGLLRGLDTVALGQIGLERTESDSENSLELQEITMVRLLRFSMPIRPVILHIRDSSDTHAGELSMNCLRIMKANAAPTQKIHLHSFGGTVEQVLLWLEAFPNCFFGIGENVSSFDKFQVAALQRIPDSNLLLESDAPYFEKAVARTNTPAFVGDIGAVVSKQRNASLSYIMNLTTQNGFNLYAL